MNVGQTVAASLSAPVIFTIAQDLRKMEVHTNVAESDIGRLKPGMRVSFTVDAYPGEPFRGAILPHQADCPPLSAVKTILTQDVSRVEVKLGARAV